MAVLFLILQPWSYSRSVVRAVCACAVFIVWTFTAFVAGVHGGPIVGAYVTWLMLVTAGLLVLVCVSGVARWWWHRRHRDRSAMPVSQ